MTQLTTSLRILQWNARGLLNEKLVELKANLRAVDPTLVLLSETHWKSKYKATFTAYNSFVLNRSDQSWGGVAILVRKGIHTRNINIPPMDTVEARGISIRVKTGKWVNVISVYCPDGTNCSEQEMQALFGLAGEHGIIGGDFNGHSGVWESGHACNQSGNVLTEILDNNDNIALTTPKDLGTRPGGPGAQPSTIDLTFMTTSLARRAKTSLGEYWSSDHLPVLIDVGVDIPLSTPTVCRWRFNNSAWNDWNQSVKSSLATYEFDKLRGAPLLFHKFMSSLEEANNKYFKAKPRNSPVERPKPWWTPECRKATKDVRRAYDCWRTTRLGSDKTALNRLEAIKKKTILRAKRASWNERVEKLEDSKNVASFWRDVNGMMNGPRETVIPLFIDADGNQVSEPEEQAAMLLDEYCPEPPRVEESDAYEEELMAEVEEAVEDHDRTGLNVPFTGTELETALRHLPNKAMGPDNIHNKMLSKLDPSNRASLLKLMNEMYLSGFVPEVWKSAIVIPILKPGKRPNSPSSFRPISLTSCLAKVMERMINNRLRWFLDKRAIIPAFQTGFTPGCSTYDNIVRLETTIQAGFNKGEVTLAAFLDYKNAYPKAWWAGILVKLARAGVRGTMLRWNANFISGRWIQVRTTDCLSEIRRVWRGVPQGAVSSPLLYNVLMSDFPSPPPGCKVSLFADDVAIYCTAKSATEAEKILQEYLTIIEEWSAHWRLEFSVNKCVAVLFSKKKKQVKPLLFLNGYPIEVVPSFKFLGVTFDSGLTWTPHITSVIQKIRRYYNIMKSLTTGRTILKLPLLTRIYKAIIRSKIDYGSIVLSELPPSRITGIDRAQNQILRIILGCTASTPLPLLYLETGITPVQARWKQLAPSN